MQYIEGYTSKPLMNQILRFAMEKMNLPDQQDTSSNPTASTTTLEVRVDPVEKITGTVEQTRGSERCGSSSTQPVQLSTPSVIPGVSMVRNTGGLEDQCRPITQGEEDIMRIHEDGIYRASDLTERTGGLWITGRILPLLEPTIFTPVEIVDSDPELEELLRDSSDIWETSPTPSSPIFQETIAQLRTTTSITRAMADALHGVLEDSLPWLRDGSPQSESNEVVQFDQIRDGDPRERESFGRVYQGYVRLKSRIEDLEAQLRSRGIL